MAMSETKTFSNATGSSVWVQVSDASHEDVTFLDGELFWDAFYIGDDDPNGVSAEYIITGVTGVGARRNFYEMRASIWVKLQANKSTSVIRGSGGLLHNVD